MATDYQFARRIVSYANKADLFEKINNGFFKKLNDPKVTEELEKRNKAMDEAMVEWQKEREAYPDQVILPPCAFCGAPKKWRIAFYKVISDYKIRKAIKEKCPRIKEYMIENVIIYYKKNLEKNLKEDKETGTYEMWEGPYYRKLDAADISKTWRSDWWTKEDWENPEYR